MTDELDGRLPPNWRRDAANAYAAGLSGGPMPERMHVDVQLKARFVDRHVSVLRTLEAFGMAEAEARELIAQTRRDGGTDYLVTRDGVQYFIRQMKGNHADVFKLGDGCA